MKIQALLPRLYLPLILLMCAAWAWRPLEGGFDFWAHAAVGKWIWANQRVPHQGLFLWTEPDAPWVAHSWLSQVLFYGIIANGGPLAVVIFSTVMAVLVFFLLYKLWQREAEVTFWTPLVFAFAIWVSAPRFQPRQELISALFVVLLLAFLIAWQNGRFDDWLEHKGLVDASIVAVPIITLFFLWINLHALVAVGLLILLVTIFADGAQALLGSDRYDAPARNRARVLLAVGVLCVGATLLNPYGMKYWEAAEILKSGSQAQFVAEWRPFWEPVAMYEYAAIEAVFFLIGLVAWWANPQRRWSHLLWLLLSAALFIRSRRMLWLSAIIFVATIAANARYLDTPTLWRKWRRLSHGDPFEAIPDALRNIARAGSVLCLVIWVVMAASRHNPKEAGDWSTIVRNVPEGAAKFLADKPATLRVFNDYEDASYLQWRLNGAPDGTPPKSGRHPLYIDLLNAYPDRLMTEYIGILDGKPSALQQLNKRKINCIVLADHHWTRKEKGRRVDTPLIKYLKLNRWKLAFQDKQSKIWVR